MYNPGGASLAPPQAKLEAAYKEELMGSYGISFNRLYCLNNMPIKRFADFLQVGSKYRYRSAVCKSPPTELCPYIL